MYNKVDTKLDFVQREKDILAFWKENHIFEKSVAKTKAARNSAFSTVLPPPTASRI